MLRLLIIVIFLVVLITFALSNPDPQTLWVVSFGWQFAIGTLVLGVGVASFLIGGLVMSVGQFRQRSRARKAEQQVRSLESQVLDLHQRLDRLNTAQETYRAAPDQSGPATSPIT